MMVSTASSIMAFWNCASPESETQAHKQDERRTADLPSDPYAEDGYGLIADERSQLTSGKAHS